MYLVPPGHRILLTDGGDQISPVCRRCKQADEVCERPKSKVRFRSSAKSKRLPEFRKDQTWSDLAQNLRYVEESGLASRTHGTLLSESDLAKTVLSGRVHAHSVPSSQASPRAETSGQSERSANLPQLAGPSDQSEQHASQSSSVSPQICAVLMRYFIQELAPWFDICDPTRHFGSVVPARAFQSPILLNAIYTASARHLANLQQNQDVRDSLQLQGSSVPVMVTETALSFQNECIHDLLRSSLDSEQIMNEDLLAASIILRTDEEMDVPLHEGEADKQIFLKVTSAFIQTQIPTPVSPRNQSSQTHYSYSESEHSFSISSPLVGQASNSLQITTPTAEDERLFLNAMAWGTIRTDGLRQACFWVAFRQELHGALMQQRPLDISLVPYQELSSFSPAEDATWANRLVVFCAESVEYCYGNRASNVQIRKSTTWKELKQKEQTFDSLLPDSFKPFYISTPQVHEVYAFPQMWYLDSIHATGAAYLELTRILLGAFDPKHQSLGLGHMTRVRNLGITLRTATKKLCGIAISNRQAPPLFLNACSAIIMCGEQFEDPLEQRAIVRFLETTQKDFAYPTKHIIKSLQEAWESEKDATPQTS